MLRFVIVDDGSSDGTREWLRLRFPAGIGRFAAITQAQGDIDLHAPEDDGEPVITIRVIYHADNLGKGGALKTGFAAATGAVIVVQDADLEYDPSDLRCMYDLIAHRQVADVVYGCRFCGSPHPLYISTTFWRTG